MPESFGARMRQRREQRQITLRSIAEHTKIKLSLLEALERDDVSHWPVGIFRRSFVRAYACSIGLEPDVVVREFLELHPDPTEDIATASAIAGHAEAGVGTRPPTRLRYLVSSAIDSLSGLGRGAIQSKTALEDVTATDCSPLSAPSRPEPDLSAVAQLCTALGRVSETHEAGPLLQSALKILDAVGLIVWVWDLQSTELRPVLAHGYSEKMLARLSGVPRDADNATAIAFRSAQTCIVKGGASTSGAVVVPLMAPIGCVGVFAVELLHGWEQRESVHALALIIASQLAVLVRAPAPRLADVVNA